MMGGKGDGHAGRTVWLVDYENVGPAFARAIHPDPRDLVVVFHHDKATLDPACATWGLKRPPRLVRTPSASQALDMRLAAELGHLLADHPRRRYVIVSDDHDFDALATIPGAHVERRGVARQPTPSGQGTDKAPSFEAAMLGALTRAGMPLRAATRTARRVAKAKTRSEASIAVSKAASKESGGDAGRVQAAMAAAKPVWRSWLDK